MTKTKNYFIIYDLYAVLLVLVYILFEGLSRGESLLYNSRLNITFVMYNILGILGFAILFFALFSKLYKVTETYFIKGFIFKKKIKWNDIISFDYGKTLRINYINKDGNQKTCNIRLFCINNNKQKYISLVNDIIQNFNTSKIEKISESAQEIVSKIHEAKIHDITDKNYKCIKKRGFLLVFILLFIYGIGDNIFDFFNSFDGIKNVYMFFSKELYHFYIGIHIVLIIKVFSKILVTIYLLSKKMFTIKIVQYYYFFEIALVCIARILMVYAAAKLCEPTLFVSFLFVLPGIISSAAFALLIKKYFTASTRVKSTFTE